MWRIINGSTPGGVVFVVTGEVWSSALQCPVFQSELQFWSFALSGKIMTYWCHITLHQQPKMGFLFASFTFSRLWSVLVKASFTSFFFPGICFNICPQKKKTNPQVWIRSSSSFLNSSIMKPQLPVRWTDVWPKKTPFGWCLFCFLLPCTEITIVS